MSKRPTYEKESEKLKHAEKMLRECEKRWRNFLSHNVAGIWRYEFSKPMPLSLPIDEQIEWMMDRGVLVECNHVAAQMYGISSADDVFGKTFREIHEYDEKTGRELLQAWIKQGYKFDGYEYGHLTYTGEYRWFLTIGNSLIENDHITGSWGSQVDVTDRKLAEEALKKSEEMYRNLFENTGTATFVVEEDMTISQINAKCEELIGYNRDEIEGKMKTPDFVSGKELERIKEYHFGRRKQDGDYPSQYELTLIDKHGDTRNAIIQIGMIPGTKRSIASIIDITPLRKTQEVLGESEERFRSLVSNIPGAVYRCKNDENWTMHFISDGIKHISSYPPSDFEQNQVRTYNSMIHPQDRSSVTEAVRKSIAHGDPFTLEYRITDRKGKVRWLYERGRAVMGRDGEVEYIDGVIFDITDRKQAEEALKESENRYRTLFESANDAIFIMKGNTFLECNPKTLEMFGCTYEQIIGKSPFTFSPLDQPDGSLSQEKALEKITDAYKGKPQIFDWRHTKHDGTPFDAQVSLNVVELKTGTHLQAIVRDITDRKLAEEALQETEKKLEAIINHHFQLTGMLDVQGRLIMANETALKYLDVAESDVIGKLFWETPWWSHSKEEQDKIQKAIHIAAKGKFVRYETSHLNKNGELRIMDFSINPVIDDEGNIKYLIPEGRDITDLKNAEDSLRRSESQLRTLANRLQEAEEMARKALARELHDQVGQSLTALNINLNILRNRMPLDALKQLEERLEDSMKLVDETTKTIRDVMAELRPSVLDDYGLTAALRWYGKRFSDRTGISIKLQMDEMSSRLTETVESALFRITQEALTNVAKHANASELVLTLQESDGLFRLIIADNGKGFDYKAFSKAGVRKGWGILNMQERIQVLGGRLQIDSEPGKGSSVIIEIRK